MPKVARHVASSVLIRSGQATELPRRIGPRRLRPVRHDQAFARDCRVDPVVGHIERIRVRAGPHFIGVINAARLVRPQLFDHSGERARVQARRAEIHLASEPCDHLHADSATGCASRGEPHGRSRRGHVDAAKRNRSHNHASTSNFFPLVTFTMTLVAVCVPYVTVPPSVGMQITPAGTAPRRCAILWLDPVPVCWLAKNIFAFERYTPLRFGNGPLLWNSGALTGVFSILTAITFFLNRAQRTDACALFPFLVSPVPAWGASRAPTPAPPACRSSAARTSDGRAPSGTCHSDRGRDIRRQR